MNGCQVIASALRSTQSILEMYLKDFTDAELFVRPVPNANHIAWQLGHLAVADEFLLKDQKVDAKYPDLPTDFEEKYGAKGASIDGPAGFLTLAEYLSLLGKVRGATIAAAEKLSDSDLDRPTEGKMAPFAPKLGDMFLLISNHTLMHASQVTVVRRKLGKPVVF